MSSELWLGYVVEDDMPETAKHKETNTRKRTALAGCHIPVSYTHLTLPTIA